MALIDYQKGHFYGLGTYDERTIFKSAGFWYSKIRKAWITDRRDVAEAIQGIYWTDRARAFVAQQDALADTSYQMSYAKESGFTPLVPDKLHPRTGKPLAFFPYQAAAIEYALPRKDCLLADAPGIGKQSSIETPIYTPSGWRRMGDLKVGDLVYSQDGKPTKVTGVFPQKSRENYEITFRDGVTTNCGPAHLWFAAHVDNRSRRIKQGKPEYQVISLCEMMERSFARPGEGNRKGLRWYIPLCEPVEHPEADLPIDPYILGVLIGDGSISKSQLCFTNADKGKQIREEVAKRLPEGLVLETYQSGVYCPRITIKDSGSGLRKEWLKHIRELGLNVTSTFKFIPDIYKRGSVKQRLDLLRGLMDTDGSCTANRTTFTTTSPYLATDIRELVQSLGGMGIRSFYDNRKTVTKRQRSMPEYRVNVKLHLCPFLLDYKAAQWKPFQHRHRYISKIERVADVDQVCIRVENPSHLYLCEHFIVTHNTPTAIGVFNCDPTVRTVLVVCPASLKEHWRREFELWKARPVTVAIAEASYAEKVQDGFYKNGKPKFKTVTHKDVWPGTDVVIINYEILDRFRDEIKSRAWDMLICDECHALKTSESGRTLFVLGGRRKEIVEDENTGKKRKEWKWYNAIDASRRLFLSGTPILNRPYELWPIVHAFDPEGLGRNEEEFCYRYCAAFHDSSRGPFGALDKSGASNEEELGRMLRERMMIRRLKKDVLPELPQKSRHIILIDTPETRKWVAREDEIAQALKLYETSTLRAGMNEFELEQAKGDQIVHAAAALDLREAFEDDGKFEARAMKLDYAAAVLGLESPYVAVLFEELAQVRRELGIAKLSGVVPWVKEFLNGSEEKLLLFAYHTDVIEALREKLKNYNPAVIYGKVPVNRRQFEVDRFQDDERCHVGVMQIDCAGVGFTMTRAWNVAFAEEDWGPKKKEQAEDRVCRIGQTAEKVLSFSLVVNGSLDCRIAQCSFFKDEVINKVMDT